jgi:hypothetical protein
MSENPATARRAAEAWSDPAPELVFVFDARSAGPRASNAAIASVPMIPIGGGQAAGISPRPRRRPPPMISAIEGGDGDFSRARSRVCSRGLAGLCHVVAATLDSQQSRPE